MQAHVIIEGQTEATTWSFVFWMVPEKAAWRVESFYLLPTSVVGKSAVDFLALARDERSVGHAFNAAMFYASARELAFRGPNLQLGIGEDIKKEFADLALPQELKGTPPFLWRFGANAYRVERANVQDINGKLALLIHHDLPAADDAKQVETQNKALITGFVAAYPETKNAFDAIVAEGVGPKGNGFRTAVDIQK